MINFCIELQSKYALEKYGKKALHSPAAGLLQQSKSVLKQETIIILLLPITITTVWEENN